MHQHRHAAPKNKQGENVHEKGNLTQDVEYRQDGRNQSHSEGESGGEFSALAEHNHQRDGNKNPHHKAGNFGSNRSRENCEGQKKVVVERSPYLGEKALHARCTHAGG